MEKMKAWIYVNHVSSSDLRWVDRPDPKPGCSDILLRMQAASLNFRDIAIACGHYHISVSAPLVPVSDGVGEVIEVGSAVTRFRVGDFACPTYLPNWIDGALTPHAVARRLGGPHDGVLAELVAVHEDAAVRAPRGLSAEEAATLPIASVTAWHSLYVRGSVQPGDTVVVQGSGGVSTSAVQLARAGGARVISVVRDERWKKSLQGIGASYVIETSAYPDWPAQVMALTSRRGADVTVNVAGGSTLQQSIAATRPGGTTHLVGYASETSAQLDIFDSIRHSATIHVAAAGNRSSFEQLVRAMEINDIRPAIARVFPVARAHEALAALQEGRHFGKIVLEF